MAYFSNGSEGEMFHDRFCCKCKRDADNDCPIWLMHLLYNYDECNKEDSLLHKMIPKDLSTCHFFKEQQK